MRVSQRQQLGAPSVDSLDEVGAQAALPAGCPGNALGGRNDILQHGCLLVTGQQWFSRTLHARPGGFRSLAALSQIRAAPAGERAFGWRCPAAQHCSCLSLTRGHPFRYPACTAEGIRAVTQQNPWWGLGSARCSPRVILWAAAVIFLSSLRWQPPHRPAKDHVPHPAELPAQQKAVAPT